jgi:tetratricopeptide (TPR) repeat protein
MDLEAELDGAIRKAAVRGPAETRVFLSYNANLGPSAEWSAIGKQHLQQGSLPKARACLKRAPPTAANLAYLAKVEALEGNLDAGRELLARALRLDPESFEALSTMGYVETQLQDFPLAVDYYQKALARRKHPALEQALAQARMLRDSQTTQNSVNKPMSSLQ